MHTNITLTLTLPAEVYDVLCTAHPNGAEAATMVALKRYLQTLPRTGNTERDNAIADKAIKGIPLRAIAKEHGLSYIRIQQIVAKGKVAAQARQQVIMNARIMAALGGNSYRKN